MQRNIMIANISVPSLSIVDVSLHLGVMASISVTPEALGEAAGQVIAANAEDRTEILRIPTRVLDRGEMMINVQQTDRSSTRTVR